MQLRDAIRTIIKEVAGAELREIVREVLLEELMAESSPAPTSRSMAAKKAAATRKANRENGIKPKTGPGVPSTAKKLGVAVGQKYKGKAYIPKLKDRLIEIAALEDRQVVPKILSSSKKRATAKRISYTGLLQNYDRVE